MVDHFSGVSLRNAGSDLFEVPLLRVQVRLHGFGEKVGAVAVEGAGQRVEGGYFVGFKTETDGLFLHKFT